MMIPLAWMDQMANEIWHHSLAGMCCTDLYIGNTPHIFLLFADKENFHLASQMPVLSSFALHGRFPPFYVFYPPTTLHAELIHQVHPAWVSFPGGLISSRWTQRLSCFCIPGHELLTVQLCPGGISLLRCELPRVGPSMSAQHLLHLHHTISGTGKL